MTDDTISGGNDNSNNAPAETPNTAPQETVNTPAQENTETPAATPDPLATPNYAATPEPGAAAAEMTPEPAPSENVAALNTPNLESTSGKLTVAISGNVQIEGQVEPTKTLRQVLTDGGISNPENYTFRNSAGHLVAMDKPLSDTKTTTIKSMLKVGGG